mmetsp:Transcript_3892/g.10969  ORF Transcript_3892/g.10969 Transcript_3892/m.10969 type:complete len:210 (-) Transcript_3892:1612-2241(-)
MLGLAEELSGLYFCRTRLLQLLLLLLELVAQLGRLLLPRLRLLVRNLLEQRCRVIELPQRVRRPPRRVLNPHAKWGELGVSEVVAEGEEARVLGLLGARAHRVPKLDERVHVGLHHRLLAPALAPAPASQGKAKIFLLSHAKDAQHARHRHRRVRHEQHRGRVHPRGGGGAHVLLHVRHELEHVGHHRGRVKVVEQVRTSGALEGSDAV